MFGIDIWLEQWLHSSATLGLVLLVSLVLGLRHAGDPDHLAAVTTLMVSQRGTRPLHGVGLMGLSWGLGHATTLLVLGLPMLLLNRYLPEMVQRSIEATIGGLIIWLSLRLLWRWWHSMTHMHFKIHAPGNWHQHTHQHAQGVLANRTPWGAYSIGLLHGAGGTGSVTLLLLSRIPDRLMATTALLLFALGTVVSMAVLTTSFGLILSTRPIIQRFHQVAPVLGMVSLGLGVAYMYQALM